MAENIGNIGPIMPQNIGDLNTNKNAPAQKQDEAVEGGVVQDKVEISKQAKAISKAVVNINNLPEIRADLVEKAIQDRVIENNRVPAYELAAKLLLEDNIE